MTSASIDIPEILLLISAHLDFKHIVPCTLVNKAWYNALAPLLFKEINTCNAKSIALERYCAHATRLRISMKSPIFNVITSKCTQLAELQVRGPGSSTTTLSKKWIEFLQKNPRITKLTALELTPRSLAVLVEHCPNLQELVVRGFQFGHWRDGPKSRVELVSPLWSIAHGLTSLDLGFNSFTVDTNVLLPCPDPMGLPQMRHLILGASYSSLEDQARFICCCKNLETLTWDLEHIRLSTMGIVAFRELFTSLRHLQELRLFLPAKQTFLGGEQLTEFLMLLPPCVVELQVRAYAVWNVTDPLIQGPLSRQFHVLETLNLRGWCPSSSCILIILRSCPFLCAFHCYTLRIKNPTIETAATAGTHSAGSIHGGVGPFGWVCIGLEKITIQLVDCMDAVTRWLFFDQLCCMKELTSVTVGGLVPTELEWYEGETPRTWRDKMIEKDEIATIPWMREVWPRLEFFRTFDKTTPYGRLSLFNHAWSG